MYVCVCVCMYVCMRACTHTLHTYNVCIYVLGALVKDLGVYRRRRLLSQLYHAPITCSQTLRVQVHLLHKSHFCRVSF